MLRALILISFFVYVFAFPNIKQDIQIDNNNDLNENQEDVSLDSRFGGRRPRPIRPGKMNNFELK